jgi:hypothetical protein
VKAAVVSDIKAVADSVTYTVVQISEVNSNEGPPPIEVRINVAYALTFEGAELAAMKLASVQPMHGPDETRGGTAAHHTGAARETGDTRREGKGLDALHGARYQCPFAGVHRTP